MTMSEPSLDTTTLISRLCGSTGPQEEAHVEPVDPYEDTSPHVTCAQREGRPPRRIRATTATWLDEAIRPRLFTPPPSRSAVQAHSTAPDGAGQPLPHHVRARMERALGGDLSSARVHMGEPQPAQDERAIAIAQVLMRLGVRQ